MHNQRRTGQNRTRYDVYERLQGRQLRQKNIRGYVDKAYDLAEKVAEARPRETDRVEALAKRYSKRMAEYMNRESNIGCRCPSVMISGAGNFPVKKKEKQVQAWEKNHQFYTETRKSWIRSMGLRGKDTSSPQMRTL